MTIEFRVRVTVPKAADDATLQRAARGFLIEVAAEIVRCAAGWTVNGGEISTGRDG